MRSFQVIDVEQRSEPWFAARCGRITGTSAAAIFAKGRGKDEAAARRDLRTRLVLEKLTGVPQDDSWMNADMKRGVELEPEAFAAYEATGPLLTRVGFVQHTELPIGFSPDGIIGDFQGLVELKCPRSATHLEYLRSKVLPSNYAAQVAHGLFVTGAQFCDFVSFDPRFPEPLRLFVVRVHRNEAAMEAHQFALVTFNAEVDREFEEVSRMLAEAA